MCSLDRGREPFAHLPWSDSHCQQHLCGRGPMKKRTEQFDGGRIRPVEVVEHEYDRLGLRQPLEQHTDSAVAAVALVLDRGLVTGSKSGQRREDGRELRPNVVVEGVEPERVEAMDVLVERVDEYPERQVALEFACAA